MFGEFTCYEGRGIKLVDALESGEIELRECTKGSDRVVVKYTRKQGEGARVHGEVDFGIKSFLYPLHVRESDGSWSFTCLSEYEFDGTSLRAQKTAVKYSTEYAYTEHKTRGSKPTPAEFRLPAYGFPEPAEFQGVTGESSTWLFIVAGIAFLAVSVGCGAWWRRKARAK